MLDISATDEQRRDAHAAWQAAQLAHARMVEAIRHGKRYSAEQVSMICRRVDDARALLQRFEDTV